MNVFGTTRSTSQWPRGVLLLEPNGIVGREVVHAFMNYNGEARTAGEP